MTKNNNKQTKNWGCRERGAWSNWLVCISFADFSGTARKYSITLYAVFFFSPSSSLSSSLLFPYHRHHYPHPHHSSSYHRHHYHHPYHSSYHRHHYHHPYSFLTIVIIIIILIILLLTIVITIIILIFFLMQGLIWYNTKVHPPSRLKLLWKLERFPTFKAV